MGISYYAVLGLGVRLTGDELDSLTVPAEYNDDVEDWISEVVSQCYPKLQCFSNMMYRDEIFVCVRRYCLEVQSGDNSAIEDYLFPPTVVREPSLDGFLRGELGMSDPPPQSWHLFVYIS